ncbi:D-alanyl-D-alanine dipeptidase [Candidatus Rickettsiella viridis]|uniref:D-alanyl-D-alanine dipeptidase n=1 Tax=Candidatus Rickettsiella viridis TaxID=676208 RepID=A0A2Z5UX86_9COXI|nr:M15 family metallopeptidase [Candidatus Rickettsiella viridis]BBB15721.1 D-alanyl-D-alanine dipeptidase [Candidatus Rickettsiella viridis]
MHRIVVQKLLLLFYTFFFFTINSYATEKTSNFVALKSQAPSIQEDIRYVTSNNFMGRPIMGYKNPICILTKQAAIALLHVQNVLNKNNLGLRVFDCYRPQMAVDDFFQWSQNPNDQKMKAEYYPHINKSELFQRNYIAHRSGHSRGSTVDLTIIDLKTNEPLDMGTPFDFLDPLSQPSNRSVSPEQFKNRMLLQTLMREAGFSSLKNEWWHFSLRNEPYKHIYFNFPVA